MRTGAERVELHAGKYRDQPAGCIVAGRELTAVELREFNAWRVAEWRRVLAELLAKADSPEGKDRMSELMGPPPPHVGAATWIDGGWRTY
jgi:hypothetical protein